MDLSEWQFYIFMFPVLFTQYKVKQHEVSNTFLDKRDFNILTAVFIYC